MHTTYCTILAQNYLPKALALAESLHRHEGLELVVLLIDAETEADLPTLDESSPPVRLVATDFLGLGREEIHRLAMSYTLVEFATAIKPVFLTRLLEDTEQAAYLDPDTYLTAPMTELPVDLAASPGGILLTPHFLVPPTDDAFLGEGHLLCVGVYNLGFVAVDRRAGAMLEWWWDHLREECLFDILSGLFVDQKWMDLGSVYFNATAWQHPGYNVSIVNLHERPLDRDGDDLVLAHPTRPGERWPVRLFHFHAFDPDRPDELSSRFSGTEGFRAGSRALDDLCREYAASVVSMRKVLPEAPAYRYDRDSSGRSLSRHIRRAYRLASLQGERLPSPFDASDAAAYSAWRSSTRSVVAREAAGDLAKAARASVPESVWWLQSRFPRLAGRARRGVVRESGIWGG